jgi:hypothetical protein
LALRAATLRDLVALWPMFDLADIDRSWRSLEAALVTLTRSRRRDSAGLAAGYYSAFRLVEGVSGRADPRVAADPPADLMRATLRIVGPILAKKAITARRPDVAETTLARLAGSVGRQVLNGGRETLVASVRSDRRARGWRRVTSGNPCDFCAGLAGEVAGKGGGFPAHDSCACSAEPVYR